MGPRIIVMSSGSPTCPRLEQPVLTFSLAKSWPEPHSIVCFGVLAWSSAMFVGLTRATGPSHLTYCTFDLGADIVLNELREEGSPSPIVQPRIKWKLTLTLTAWTQSSLPTSIQYTYNYAGVQCVP